MKYNHSLSNKTTIVTVLFLSVWCCWLLASNLTARPIGELPKLVESSVSCKTRSSSNQAVFRVHVPVEPLARRLAPALCQDEVVAKQYGHVEVRYSGELAEQIDYIAKGLADLTLSKDNVMAALKAQSTYNYMPVVGYPTYTAFFISNREKPRLDKAYFLDKKIGLLDYPTSRSGHIIPKQMFKRLELDMRVLDIQYVSSHQVLRKKLSSGELDIIATYWQESDESRFSANYITPIGENISGSRWYMKMDVDNTDLACALQNLLQEVAKNNGSSYFDELDLYWQCNELPVYFIGEKNES